MKEEWAIFHPLVNGPLVFIYYFAEMGRGVEGDIS